MNLLTSDTELLMFTLDGHVKTHQIFITFITVIQKYSSMTIEQVHKVAYICKS